MSELSTPTNSPENVKELSRRRVLGLGAGAAAGLLVAGERISGIASAQVATPPPATPSPEGLPQPAEEEPIMTSEELRIIAEADEGKLVETFQITTEQASTPEEFAGEYAKRLELALNAGCTKTEVEDYINNGGHEAYLAAMSDKYDLAAVMGIYGIPDSISPAEVMSGQEYGYIYGSFVEAHKATLQRYFNAMNVGMINQYVNVESADIVDKGDVNGALSITVNLNVTDNYAGSGAGAQSYNINSSVALMVDSAKESGVCKVSMDPTAAPLFAAITNK